MSWGAPIVGEFISIFLDILKMRGFWLMAIGVIIMYFSVPRLIRAIKEKKSE